MFFVSAAIAVSCLVLFGEALLTSRTFVYRDAAHFYYPLFRWISGEWSAGRIPLWNPLDNSGVPIVADATSSVFYPGKLLFLVPWGFGLSYKIYVVGHVVIAAGAAFRLARHWQRSVWAAGLCALSYAFGGPVLFQYCNVVFLVGAAWLPLAILFADRMLTLGRWRDAFGLGAIQALMVLGGDPQMAYNAGVCAAAYSLIRTRTRIGRVPVPSRRSISLLTVAAGTAAGLAAIQILPAADFSRRTVRAAYASPRNVYEAAAFVFSEQIDTEQPDSAFQGLFGQPTAGTHHQYIYDFSVGPWRLAELIWPNFSGRQFPVNRRWLNAVPAEGRVWSPSLYIGLLPLLLALGAGWRSVGLPHGRLLKAMVIAGTLASFGWYGIGWLIHEIDFAVNGAGRDGPWIGQPVGGLYWLMTTCLPGYVYFRFPAKLFPLAALGLSVLAAHGLDRVDVGSQRQFHKWLYGTAAISIVALAITFFLQPHWAQWMEAAPRDNLFGPVDPGASLKLLRMSLSHTTAVCLAAVLVFRFCSQTVRLPGVLFLTVLDLCVAHSGLLPTAPESLWTQTPRIAELITASPSVHDAAVPPRVFRNYVSQPYPDAWQNTSSTTRQTDGLRWDRQTLFPRYHLLDDIALMPTATTLRSQDFQAAVAAATRDIQHDHHSNFVDALGAEFLLTTAKPSAERWPIIERFQADDSGSGIVLLHNRKAFPRVWFAGSVRQIPPLSIKHPDAVHRRTELVFYETGGQRNFRNESVLEAGHDFKRWKAAIDRLPADRSVVRDVCRIIEFAPARTRIEVAASRPRLMVISDFYDRGWKARLVSKDTGDSRPVPIWRTNRVMCGVYLPPGRYEIEFRYRPVSFYAGASISLCSLLVLLVARWRSCRKHLATLAEAPERRQRL